MTTASPYISTKNISVSDIEPDYYLISYGGLTQDTSPAGLAEYLKNNGNTYLTPFTIGPFSTFISPSTYDGITQSNYTKRTYLIGKSLEPVRRALQNFNTVTYTNYWVGDQISITGRSYNGYTGNWATQTLNNSYPGIWPITGVCQAYRLLDDWLDGASKNGVTYSILMIDNEGTNYEPSGLATDISNALKGDTRYYQRYFGLTSWDEIYSSFGGTGNPASGGTNQSAWWAAKDAYQAKIFQLSWLPAMLKYNPTSIVSNYSYFKEGEEPLKPRNSVWPQDGSVLPHLEPGGNAGAPELYGGMRATNGARLVKRFNGKELDTQQFTNNFRPFNKYLKGGPWASFILTLAEARSAKRGSPSTALTPWIGSVDWQGPEYIRGYLEYRISGGFASQSPPEVLNTTWYKNNLTVTQGYTAYDGSTAAFRIVTNNNINNATLEYYLNGITHGLTYIFSYYVDLNSGFTNQANCYQQINHFKPWTYNYPRGITFDRILPSVTGPFYNTGTADYSGYSGWTKVSYKFTTVKNLPDISDNLTLSLSVFGCTGTTLQVGGVTAFFSHPTLEIENSPSNIPLFVSGPLDEYNFITWNTAPPSGFANLKVGYNPRNASYITETPGNSGYYYDYIRHLSLLGSKHFGYFNPSQFVDMGYTGSLARWVNTYNKEANGYFACTNAYENGWTGWLDEQKEFNDCLKDINDRLGGFTTTTADYSEYDWNSTYIAHGAPALNGNTWWWRVTVKPGYTMICNGITLSSANGYPVGTWISTTGPTLAGIGITWNAWELPGEPGYTAPTKVFDFLGMTYNNRVKEVGFNFTRNTIGTYIGSSGYLMTASINEPRLEYDPETGQSKGLLLEAAATNYLNWSETFATAGGCNNNWIDFNITRTAGNTSPSGNTGAIRFTATGGNAYLMMTSGVTTGVIYGSWSCWFRGISGTESLYVTVDGGTTWSLISNLSNKWKRFGSEVTETEVGIFDSPFYMGFKLGNTGDSVEIWGAQVEERRQSWGALAKFDPLNVVQYTSYISSGATRGTRGHEKCEITGTSFSSWFGITQGTMLLDILNGSQIVIPNSAAYFTAPLLYQYNNTAVASISRYNVTNQSTSTGIITYWPFPQSGYPLNTPIKSIFSYDPYGLKISSNKNLGTTTFTGVTQYIYNYNTLSLTTVFGQFNDRPQSQQHVRKIMYWNYVWNEDDMKAMSLANIEQFTTFNPYG